MGSSSSRMCSDAIAAHPHRCTSGSSSYSWHHSAYADLRCHCRCGERIALAWLCWGAEHHEDVANGSRVSPCVLFENVCTHESVVTTHPPSKNITYESGISHCQVGAGMIRRRLEGYPETAITNTKGKRQST